MTTGQKACFQGRSELAPPLLFCPPSFCSGWWRGTWVRGAPHPGILNHGLTNNTHWKSGKKKNFPGLLIPAYQVSGGKKLRSLLGTILKPRLFKENSQLYNIKFSSQVHTVWLSILFRSFFFFKPLTKVSWFSSPTSSTLFVRIIHKYFTVLWLTGRSSYVCQTIITGTLITYDWVSDLALNARN